MYTRSFTNNKDKKNKVIDVGHLCQGWFYRIELTLWTYFYFFFYFFQPAILCYFTWSFSLISFSFISHGSTHGSGSLFYLTCMHLFQWYEDNHEDKHTYDTVCYMIQAAGAPMSGNVAGGLTRSRQTHLTSTITENIFYYFQAVSRNLK